MGGGRMIKTDKDKAICAKYSTRDENGNVHCNECPLVRVQYDLMCKANSHYNPSMREWEYDLPEVDA